MNPKVFAATFLLQSFFACAAPLNELKVGADAPLFTTKTFDDKDFNLADRKKSGNWTVLYFYPKANTPGCTKQACAFRDNIKKITALKADVYGISTDSVEDQAAFHKEHHLNFPLLADSDARVAKSYGTLRGVIGISNRWTFVIDDQLKIRAIEKDVDPAFDSERVAKQIAELRAAKPK